MEKTDEELVLEFISRREESFEILLKRYLNSVYSFIFKLCRIPETAEDLTQDCFFKVWKNLKNFDSRKSSFKTWVFVIARNVAFDWLRKNREINFSEIFADGDESNFERFSYSQEPVFKELLSGLSQEEKEIVLLRIKNGFAFHEIAKKLNKPLNTVKSQYRRLVLRLKKKYAPNQ